MLQKLGHHIEECLKLAEAAERRAAAASDVAVREDNEHIARRYRHLARSFQFIESLERFLLDAERHRDSPLPMPPIERGDVIASQLAGTTFDPDTLVMLSAVYDRAMAQFDADGLRRPEPEIVAKYIIALASEGERDPDRLCSGVLALCGFSARGRG